MIHPHTKLEYISDQVGFGVVAQQPIPKGTVTWVMSKLDRIFSPRQIRGMASVYLPMIQKYSFRDSKGRYVLCWDYGRYVNHSFSPNCLTTAYDFEVAIRDIEVGEQLTNHYGYLNLEPMKLLTDNGNEEQWVTKEDVLKHFPEWDDELRKALKSSESVEQPLSAFLNSRMRKVLKKLQKDPSKMVSIKTCYYEGGTTSKTSERKVEKQL
ncbi:MAG: SET domain-containing protein [Bdellovibrionota bacterium]